MSQIICKIDGNHHNLITTILQSHSWYAIPFGSMTIQIEKNTLHKFGVVKGSAKNIVDKLEGDKFYMNATHLNRVG